MQTLHEMEGGPTETPHARVIVDAIVDGRLVKVECPAHPEASCVITWTPTAYEQIDAYVRDQIRLARLADMKAATDGRFDPAKDDDDAADVGVGGA